MDRAIKSLTEFCKDRGGRTLRGVYSYTKDDINTYYTREDIQQKLDQEALKNMQESVWHVHQTVLEEQPKIQSIGDYRVTVHTFEQGFAMQFRESSESGALVVFDTGVGRNLHEFLVECEKYLD